MLFVLFFSALGWAREWNAYTVQKDEWLIKILQIQGWKKSSWNSSKFLRTIVKKNNLQRNGDLIFPGQKILLPTPSPESKIPWQAQEEKGKPDHSIERAPAQETVEFKGPCTSQLRLEPVFYYSKWEGMAENGMQAKFVSDLGVGAQGAWETCWSPWTFSRLAVRLTQVNIAEDPAFTLVDTHQSLGGLSLGLYHHLDAESMLGLDLGLEEHMFYRGLTPTVIQIEKASIPFTRLSYDRHLWSGEEAHLRGNAGALYLFSQDTSAYKIQSGFGYEVGLSVVHKNLIPGASWQIYYRYLHQKANSLDLERSDLGLNLSFPLMQGSR